MAPLEVVGAGFGRTGTDSLRTALNILGYKTHHMKEFKENPDSNDPDRFYDAYKEEDRTKVDWDNIYRDYTAAVDWPTAAFWPDLHKKYPEAKIILTVRDEDSWYKSVKNTIASFQQNRAEQSVGKQVDTDDPNYKLRRMAEAVCLDGLFTDSNRFKDEEKVKQHFLDNIKKVKETIPENQLLVMKLGDGWEELCTFLKKDIPNQPYPNVNSTEQFQKYKTELEKGIQHRQS
ncbi:hypothetical protein [Parasitella parasitica]|uniref:Sulfotransferase domain-containing protein n=1 Tax=Parasitella parasitica TaxID=35722 RepID=A0A0B7MNH8_9FUNG|nr:hypothetical protein [Parasitella parasitica]